MNIAVVIVNFNSGSLLAKCLDHLARQTRLADSILVIDNGSVDNSMTNLPSCDALHCYPLGENRGFAAANNFAFDQISDADYFVTLNPDAFVTGNFLEKLESAALANPQYASFATRMMLNDSTLDGAGDIYHCSGLAWRAGHGKPYRPSQHTEREVFSACAGAAMYRAQDLHNSNGFDETFFCYMEDVDLGYRLQLQGRLCLYVPDAVVTHMASAITAQYPGFAVYHGHRNLVWTLVKNTPVALLPLAIPAHLLMTFFLGLVYLSRGELAPYMRGKWDACKGLRQVLAQRKTTQLTRRTPVWDLLGKIHFGFKR